MIDAVITRLKGQAPAFHSRIEGAASFAALIEAKRLPNQTPAAHVVPVGMTGGKADAASGVFTQDIDETIGVIITVRSRDTIAGDKLEPIDTLRGQVVQAVAGWAPGDEVGVFKLVNATLRSAVAGAIVYQLDFRISDQLRITS